MLKLIVFLGGAALMGLEMVGSRVLAPHFGSSIFVWGSLISIFLTALSIGYTWGGGLADRRPSLSVLGSLMIVPGLWVGFLPFVAPGVNEWVVGLALGPRFSPLVSSLILFAVPSIFLGTISPYAVRLEVQSVESAGNTAGRLYALSTAGSIVGTLVTSFVLIPALGVRNILHTLGFVLLLLALGALAAAARSSRDVGPGSASGDGAGGARRSPAAYSGEYLGRNRGKKSGRPLRGAAWATRLAARADLRSALRSGLRTARFAAVTLGIVALGVSTQLHSLSAEILYQKDSLYHRIIVEDHGWVRHLHFDNSYQSAMNLEDPYDPVFPYTRYLHLARLFHPDARKAFFMGLGGGAAPARFLRDYPELSIDVAEIDPEVVRVAYTYFNLPDDPRLRVVAQDGRLFLRQSSAVYDLMVLDAYFGESIPFHLTTKEFLEELRARLADDGVVAANIIGALAGPQSRLLHSMVKTYQSVFPQVYVFGVGAVLDELDPLVRNIILIATASPERLSADELRRRADAFVAGGPDRIDVRPYIDDLVEIVPAAGVPVLTDDYAPVDSLQHVW